jgi:hypothetical protein
MLSQLFAGDVLLAQVANDREGTSRARHANDRAVAKVQTALLSWDPGCVLAGRVPVVVGDPQGSSPPFAGFAEFAVT